VSFGDANAVDTTASFSASGVYVLRLTADDGQLTASDDITVTVNPAPQGNENLIFLPNISVNLNGAASNVGLPDSAQAITQGMVSEPATVTSSAGNAQEGASNISSIARDANALPDSISGLYEWTANISFDPVSIDPNTATTIPVKVEMSALDSRYGFNHILQVSFGDAMFAWQLVV
jgi:hypothetical protein